uniref:General transcription factor 3C polypeptide 5 n=1 Tax=Strigamia maritima TaxID=126957 RepID=T1J199_STRMM
MAAFMALNERKFVAIEHPTIVGDANKLLNTLGGIDKISSTYANPSHRLELYFRPKDPYCKPVFGDRQNTTNLLLKVKRKKASDGKVELTSEILGVVGTTYKFQSMVDFQILPMERESGSYKPINDELLPKIMEKSNWVKEESPLFILPPVFARLDNPGDYLFGKDPTRRNANSDMKYRRMLHAKNISFEDSEIPTNPLEGAIAQFVAKGCAEEILEEARQLFANRPIWHRSGVLAELKVNKEKIKLVLPVVAYTFLSGPWRGLWVCLGFDPRQDASSKIYQILDFRVRQTIARNIPIQSKRSSCGYILPNKISQSIGRIPLIRDDLTEAGSSNKDSRSEMELSHKFNPTVCPPVRQLFYQFCDIEVPEVHHLLSQCPPQPTCHEKFGWLDIKTYEECRNILATIVQTLCKETEKGKQKINFYSNTMYDIFNVTFTEPEDDAVDDGNTMDIN